MILRLLDKRPRLSYAIILLFLSLTVALSFQGSRGLYETTEGRYAESALEMIKSGNYLEPTLSYKYHWTKPPLTYWAIAGGIKLLGFNEWGVRIYNVIAFCLTVSIVSLIGKTLYDEKTGFLAGLIYLSSPYTVFGAYSVSTDNLLTLWEVSAVFCYLKAFHKSTSESYKKWWITAMWLFFGLGFLTKGPAVLLPIGPVFLYHFIKKRSFIVLYPLGLILFIFVGLSWYFYISKLHPGVGSYWINEEVIERITTGKFHRNPEWYAPFEFYLPVLTIGLGPWLFFLIRRIFRKKMFSLKQSLQFFIQGNSRSFLLLWFTLPLIVYVLSKSRLWLYVLPLYAPLTIAVSREFMLFNENKNIVRRACLIAIIAVAVIIGMKGFTVNYPNKNNMKSLYQLCGIQKGSNVEVIAFEERYLHGLQFYLDGKLKRVSLKGKNPWADGSIQEEMDRLNASVSSSKHLFVSRKSKARELESFLKNANLLYQRKENNFWAVFIIR